MNLGSFTSGAGGGGLAILLKLEIMDVRAEERVFSFSFFCPTLPLPSAEALGGVDRVS